MRVNFSRSSFYFFAFSQPVLSSFVRLCVLLFFKMDRRQRVRALVDGRRVGREGRRVNITYEFSTFVFHLQDTLTIVSSKNEDAQVSAILSFIRLVLSSFYTSGIGASPSMASSS